jgi:hypothetical protein
MPAAKKEPINQEQKARLTRLFLEGQASERFASEEDMGARFELGNQAFVSQLKLGRRPLNFETSAKWARACDVPLSSVSPDLAAQLTALAIEFLPKEGFEIREASAKKSVGEPESAPKEGVKGRVFRTQARAMSQPKRNNLSGVIVGAIPGKGNAPKPDRQQQPGRRSGENPKRTARKSGKGRA